MKPRSDFGLGRPPRNLVRRLEHTRVFQQNQLRNTIKEHTGAWSLAQGLPVDVLIDWLLQHNRLRRHEIRSELRGRVVRYTWGEVSPLEIACSLAPKGYLSHASAASLHGLLTYKPDLIYLNKEQSAKPTPSGELTQAAIDRAFASKQRMSRDIYSWQTARVVVLSGKNSGGLGVQTHVLGDAAAVRVTGLERTLIDLTVRPDYAGGVQQVVEAFGRAKGRFSVARLLEVLAGLDYRYPYHQSIGFYMQMASYSPTSLADLAALGRSFDFYLGYDIRDAELDAKWRIHFPAGLRTTS